MSRIGFRYGGKQKALAVRQHLRINVNTLLIARKRHLSRFTAECGNGSDSRYWRRCAEKNDVVHSPRRASRGWSRVSKGPHLAVRQLYRVQRIRRVVSDKPPVWRPERIIAGVDGARHRLNHIGVERPHSQMPRAGFDYVNERDLMSSG